MPKSEGQARKARQRKPSKKVLESLDQCSPPVKRGRGRPRKILPVSIERPLSTGDAGVAYSDDDEVFLYL